jgi:hypothetical protein
MDRTEQELADKRNKELIDAIKEAFNGVAALLPKNDNLPELISTFDKRLSELIGSQKAPEVNVQVQKVSNEEVVGEITLLKDIMGQVLQELRTKQEFAVQLIKNGFGVTTSAIFKQK